jgi:beta-N-acetylhexosaminidase
MSVASVPTSTLPRVPRPAVTAARCTAKIDLDKWSLDELAAQLVVTPVDETDLQPATPAAQAGVGGIVLFGDEGPEDLHAQIAQLDAAEPAGVPVFVMTDEEGGEIQRLPNLVGSIPWPRDMAQTLTTDAVRSLARRLAVRLVQYGVTMDLAPVLDLSSGPGPDAEHTDGPRSFSGTAAVAENYGLAFAEGLLEGGVVPVVKHFPGEGNTTANTDYGPATTPPLVALEGADLLPFEAAIRAGLPAVMVGNATIPGLTTGPASLSHAAIDGFLRQRLGFKGLVLTDSLSAGAITADGISVPQAAVDAVSAGADMVLFTSETPVETTLQVVDTLVAAADSGPLSRSVLQAAAGEVLTAKNVKWC